MVKQKLTDGWVPGRTWAETYLHSGHIRTELMAKALHLYAPPVYVWQLLETQQISSGRWATVRWTDRGLGDNAWELQEPGSTWRAPIPGLYLVSATVGMNGTNAGDRGIELLHNDRPLTGSLGPPSVGIYSWGCSISGLFLADTGDSIEVQVFQTSDEPGSIGYDNPRSALTVAWLGATP